MKSKNKSVSKKTANSLNKVVNEITKKSGVKLVKVKFK